jgi:capsular polysaccharide transport system permease protein
MVVETKDKTTDHPIVDHVSAALPAVRRALGILGFRAIPERFDAGSEKIEPIRAKGSGQPQTVAEGASWLIASFTIVVIVPVIAASIYFALFASDRFVSELRFAVRGSTEHIPGADALGTVGSLAYMNSSQEVYAIADYIRSRSAVEEIGRTVDLRQIFQADKADWLSRLEYQAPGEELLRYWRQMISVSTEAISGLVSVEVRAFTPDDAVALASAIRAASEALVNRMQLRPRNDMVTRAESEVRIARERAAQTRAEVAQYRNSQASVDPLDTARSLIDNVTELKGRLIELDVEFASAEASMGPNAPTAQTILARRDSLREQIQGLERRITSSNAGDRTAAKLMVDYDRVEIAQALAEQQVAVAEKMLDQLRADANRRQVYIDVIEGPTTPQSALFPERTRSIAEIAIAATGLWCVVFLTIAGIRDHTD